MENFPSDIAESSIFSDIVDFEEERISNDSVGEDENVYDSLLDEEKCSIVKILEQESEKHVNQELVECRYCHLPYLLEAIECHERKCRVEIENSSICPLCCLLVFDKDIEDHLKYCYKGLVESCPIVQACYLEDYYCHYVQEERISNDSDDKDEIFYNSLLDEEKCSIVKILEQKSEKQVNQELVECRYCHLPYLSEAIECHEQKCLVEIENSSICPLCCVLVFDKDIEDHLKYCYKGLAESCPIVQACYLEDYYCCR